MKNKLHQLIATFGALCCLIAITACDKDTLDENAPSEDNKQWSELKGNIVVLNEQAADYVESYESNSIIKFSSATPSDLIPDVGNIIYVPESENTPYGYLGKIIKIENDNGYKVFTETAPLDEAFGNLSVTEGIESIESIEEVLDADGNPIEYEMVDSIGQDSGYASRAGSFGLKNKFIRFPFKLYNHKESTKSIELSGNIYAGIKQFLLQLDVNNNSTSSINLEITPCVGLRTTSNVKVSDKIETESVRLGQIRVKATIPTPVGIPIIVPITFYVYGSCGASGEISATLSFNPEFSTKCSVQYKNGQWTYHKNDTPAKNPWAASEFEVKGEVFSNIKIGVLVGLYSATTGIGLNIVPNYSISCSASIKSENILNINPLVDRTIKVSGEVYCVAKLFGKQLGKISFSSPEYVLWNDKIYLLPQYSDFNAIGHGSKGNINYKICHQYFLKFLGFKAGLTIFENDKKTEIETAYPTSSKVDENGHHYSYTTKELLFGKTYYASPTIYGLNKKFHGEKHEFTTEYPNICGNWTAVWHTTPPNAKLLTMSLDENLKCTQTYYYANRGENVTYTCDYSYAYPILTLYKDNGDTQHWEIAEITASKMTLRAADGFCYYLSK